MRARKALDSAASKAYTECVLDLRAKLAAAGVVTKEQVDKFDSDEAAARDNKRAQPSKSDSRKGGSRPKRKTANRSKAPADSGIDVEALKKLNRGDAYTRIRKIVEHSRLDDKERTIPLPDDQIFNFVTSKGRVSRLYLTAKTVESLTSGESAISSFMSHHGLSHCVLPKEVALAFAEVFPLWLRHLQGHVAAGLLEADEADLSE
jgi:uncharacterized protein YaiL (DUF2058 family)